MSRKIEQMSDSENHAVKNEKSTGKKISCLGNIALALWFLAVISAFTIFAVPDDWKWFVAKLFIVFFAVFSFIIIVYSRLEKKDKDTTADRKHEEGQARR